MKTMRRLMLLGAVCTVTVPLYAQAQAPYPNKAVEIIVPYPPGGGPDTIARSLAQRLGQLWAQPVVVQNHPGASAAIGQGMVARAAPDGYTLLVTSDAPITTSPHVLDTLPYDPMRDFKPVSQILDANLAILLHGSEPQQSLAELVESARQSSIPYGSFGQASQPHIFFAGLGAKTGADLLHVPYRGNTPALQAAIAGDVKLAMSSIGVAKGHTDAGRLRALAISGKSRSALAPEVPTLAELGYEDLDPRPWFGLFAPAGTPDPIVQQIWQDLSRIYEQDDARQQDLISRGYEPVLSSPETFATVLQDEFVLRGKQIELGNIRVE
ncbi:MAG: Bug family tripartite tricarboxylate transporter substrate binding protein [Pigmentiphaga sp.]